MARALEKKKEKTCFTGYVFVSNRDETVRRKSGEVVVFPKSVVGKLTSHLFEEVLVVFVNRKKTHDKL